MPTTNDLLIGVILVNYNGLVDTIECVESLHRTRGDFRIIIVDNNSRGGQAGALQSRFPDCVVLALTENVGFSQANNIGIAQAKYLGCGYVLILNNDTVVTPDFLAPLLSACEQRGTLGLATPKILFHGTKIIWAAGGKFNYLFARGTNIGEGQPDHAGLTNPAPDFVSGCCFLAPMSVAARLEFPPEYFLYYEDVDYSFQVRKLGLELAYVPASVIYHKSGQSAGQLLSYRRIYYLARNKLLLVQRTFSPGQKIAFWLAYPLQTLAMISYFAWRRPGQALALTRAWTRGMMDFFQRRFGPLAE